MPAIDRKPGGSSLVETSASPGTSGASQPHAVAGKQTLTQSLPMDHGVQHGTPTAAQAAPAEVASYDDMLAAVLAAQPLTVRATGGDNAARAQVFKLLAPVEARLSQLNDHQGRLAQFGAGNIAGQATLDMAETAIRSWRQRLALGTVVRTDELVLRFRAGAEPIRFLTGEAKDAPTLREFNHVSGVVGVGAAAPVLAPAMIALAVEEAPLLAFAARTTASRVALWALHNPAAALAATEALLGYGVQIGEGGWEAFWSPLDDPQGRWLFLLQILMDYVHVQSALHGGAPRARGAASPEASPDVDGARQRLTNVRQALQQVEAAANQPGGEIAKPSTTAEPYSGATLSEPTALETLGGARKPRNPGPRRGKPAPDNPFEHVTQKEPTWCGAACGEMAAGRLGAKVDQDELAATPQFSREEHAGGDQTTIAGGFQTDDLSDALKEVAPIAGRKWLGGVLPQDIAKPAGLLRHLKGYLSSTKASIILRVSGGRHWIIVDSVTPDDKFVIRDPGEAMSTILTAEELSAMHPVGQAVFSFPEKTK